jgi:predicted house-cleaning noncanonical NTP pyrophosphatase (MazG superfamily)
LSAEVRFKRDFLQEQADGSWEYVAIARQFGRNRVLSSEALAHIALQTVAVSRRLGQRAQIMWFCDLPPELGMGSHLPWYRSRDFQVHTRVERPPYRPREIHTLQDIERLSAEDGNYILAIQPTADLVREDENFLDKVIDVARIRNLPVELSGSVLGHAYYRLIDEGLMVLAAEPKYQRSRGKKAHHKLVRDAIPANIAAKGERVSFGRLAPEEAVTALVGKLFEEGLEISDAKSGEARIEELADVFEVFRGLAKIEGVEWQQVLEVANRKRDKRGGFDQQTVLIETEKPKTARDERPLAGESEAPLSINKIGIVANLGDGIQVPFTRLIGDRAIASEVTLAGMKVSVHVGMDTGSIVVRLLSGHSRSREGEAQGQLFAAED